jgi:hypothetical protein
VFPASSIKAQIASIPSYARFGYSGVGSLGGKFYATTNLGVLEISEGQVSALYQWNTNDRVVSGPWENKADRSLVFQEALSLRFITLKDGKWHWLPLPKPPAGDFTRRGVLQGFRGYSNQKAFWMVGGGHAWRWDSSVSQWAVEAMPASEEGVVALMPLNEGLLSVSRNDSDILGKAGSIPGEDKFESDRIHRFADGSWSEVKNEGAKFITKQVVSNASEGFIRTGMGTILAVSGVKTSMMEAPGTCETLVMTSAGKLMGSFRGKGIYEFEKGWVLRFACPYGADEGEHWAYLAEANGKVVFATTSIPTLKKTYTGTTSLWLSKDDKLQIVPVESK